MKPPNLRTLAAAIYGSHPQLAIDCLRMAGYTRKAAERALSCQRGDNRGAAQPCKDGD